MSALLLILNFAATWFMVGLIWMVQCVHYAMFDRVGESVFSRYAIDHARLITPIVGVPMLIELATAVGLVVWTPAGVSRGWMIVAIVLLAIIWISTAVLQVPCHEQLASGFRQDVYQRLVSTNWIRTVAWTLRGLIVGYVIYQQKQGGTGL